jgi:hypothetical protein
MASCKANKDVATLFYFVREYFANHQPDPTNLQQQQPSDSNTVQARAAV